MGKWWCCFKFGASRQKSDTRMNRLIYMMFLQIAETGREREFNVPTSIKLIQQREYFLLMRALKKNDETYFVRTTSTDVIYTALKNYLEDLPTPMMVNKISENAWWISLADDLILTFVFRSAHTPSLMKPVYADKIKKKLRTLNTSKFVLTMCMISMLRAITWNEKYKRFKSELLTAFIDDLRRTFLVVPKNLFLPELDTVIIIVTFMVQNAYLIFGPDVDNCLVGIHRPRRKSSAVGIATTSTVLGDTSAASFLSVPPSSPMPSFKISLRSDTILTTARNQKSFMYS